MNLEVSFVFGIELLNFMCYNTEKKYFWSDEQMKMKKLVCLITVVCMCLSLFATAVFADKAFDDVKPDDWFYDSVCKAVDKGFMNGVSESSFDPMGDVTRGMFATVLYRMENRPRAIYAEEFSDIKNEDYFANAVRWANANGIVNGVSETEFAPNDFITREQIAAMIYRYAGFKNADISTSGVPLFKDSDKISDYAIEPSAYAWENGFMNGDENGNMCPDSNATRAEISAIVMRIYTFFDESSGDIIVLYTNDVHGGFEGDIGYAGVKAYKDDMKKTHEYVALVDSGDAVQGDVTASLSKGEYIVDMMNATEYDYAILGNHEFDYGMEQLDYLMNKSDATYLNCNIKYTGKNKDMLEETQPYAIDTYGDKKVAYIGVSTPYSVITSSPKYFMENDKIVYSFSDESKEDFYACIQKNIDECKAQGADYVVLLTHCGKGEEFAPYDSASIARNTSGIDVILDGHSHTVIEGDNVDNKDGKNVVITSTGTKLANMGKLTIKENGEIKTELIDKYDKKDENVTKIIDGIKTNLDEILEVVVAEDNKITLSVNDGDGIRMVRNRETAIGDFCADAYKEVLGADIGILNGGAIRTDIKAGNITVGNIIDVHPFANEVCVISVKGSQIADALEWAYKFVEKDYKREGAAVGESGGFLQLSGLMCTIDTNIPTSVVFGENNMFAGVSGERRVKDIMVMNKDGRYEPIDMDKEYTIAGIAYTLLNNGDGQTAFNGAEKLVTNAMIDSELLMKYIAENLKGDFSKYEKVDNRITILK